MPDEPQHTTARRILICEHETPIAEDMARILTSLGYEAAELAFTGEEAVLVAEKARPDLVLMDINLAGKIEGIEAADQIRSRMDIPVIYITDYTQQDVLERAKKTEPYGYIGQSATSLEVGLTIGTALYKHKMDKKVKESEALYKALVETTDTGYLIIDQEGRVLDANPEYARLTGHVNVEEIRGRCVVEWTAEHDRERNSEEVKKCIGQGFIRNLEIDYVDKSGNFTPVEINATVASISGTSQIVALCRDITKRKKAEEALRTSQQRLELALWGADLGLWDWDLNTSRVVWNKQAVEMLGYTSGEVERNLRWGKDLFHPEDWPKVSEALTAHVDGRSPTYESEYRLRSKSGEWKWILTRGKIVAFDNDGKPLRMTGTLLDITKRKSAEQEREDLIAQLAQSQKMEAIGTLIGGIAHDFNNLLTIINGYTEMLLVEKTEGDPSYSDLQTILDTGRKGADLVQRLLVLSRKGESNPQPLNLNRTVENSSKLMERTFPRMIEIDTILEEDLRTVNADDAQIEQVLMNLCINAKEAMPDGGKLMIETKNVAVDESYCKRHLGAKLGPHVAIEVADTGAGMDAETLGRIFDPFFTTKGWDFKKGTGLGLSVAKGIVEQHGGWLTCQSEPGKGTTFTIYFPAIEDLPAAQTLAPSAETVPGPGKILLVDDEENVRNLGKRILEHAGYAVITAANGKEALDIYARELSKIALVVLDLIMPQMGGGNCLEELLKINPKLRVVVSSGHSLNRKELDRLSVYAKGFVNKPYQMKEFMEVVRGVLAAK